MKITRHPENPIVVPGLYDWRKVTVFNPAVIIDNGKFYMIERTAGSLTPCKNYLGLLESADGVHFTHVLDEPVVTPDQLGFPYGSIQDPRIVKIDDTFYLNYALRPCAMNYYPTGAGIPERSIPEYPDGWGEEEGHWLTRSGILTSKDLIQWEYLCDTTPLDINDRDNILFPEKINGKYVLLRRPEEYVGEEYGTEKAAMWISYSEDLVHWEEPKLLAKAENNDWEFKKIGGSTPPVRTDKGWLVLYHGVDQDTVYRVGALLLDLENPEKIIARTRRFIMEPETYYEKFGYQIPNVVFPTGNVVKDGLLYIYYGVTDTAIALATVPLDELVDYILDEPQ
ncbi:glycosidase [Paenibacillus sp. p3-SID867]|uniref:glycoside hydrolase family 130 protein n=1 Tax=Paenibacillus sp. p3-SID867 TaxID=2916363 RepID=UPI0021A297C3|nr:glycosidase [Paenibacillus sp. p3-SID867]MCT1400526.1 glycosidase [Paenibacillus sp. p3-SID867]